MHPSPTAFAAKRKEAMERAEVLREQRKAQMREREAAKAMGGGVGAGNRGFEGEGAGFGGEDGGRQYAATALES